MRSAFDIRFCRGPSKTLRRSGSYIAFKGMGRRANSGRAGTAR